MLATSTRTTCPYCGVGCGVVANAAADGVSATVAGDQTHPANRGKLCSKGSSLGETLGLSGRLLTPMVNGYATDWRKALRSVAQGFADTIRDHGPDAVAFYVSGQFLTEDYYVANKLMKGFIGSGNIDTNSRLCMASTVAAQRRAFGADVVPGSYEDLDKADLVIFVGSNAAWCHPVLFQRMKQARAERGQHWVCIDPRRTATSDESDLHLKIKAGSDVLLWNALLAGLWRRGIVDRDYLDNHTDGIDAALDAALTDAHDLDNSAIQCGLSPDDLARFIDLFATTDRTVTLWSQGANQSSSGTDKVNAIINCHLATGRIGKPGMGPFSLTGQPNAMGGREVGGLANQLAAHLGFEDEGAADLVAGFWNTPAIARQPGLKAVDMFRAVGDGRIKAIWIMGTNPVASMPDAGAVAAALSACPLVVVSDGFADTDTARLAHVLLPAALWGEKDGTVTNSERRISRQRAFLPLPGEARPDWWIMAQVARLMGFADAFNYTGPADIFREHAALTGVGNTGTRPLDLSPLAGISNEDFDALAPVQWPIRSDGSGTERLFGQGGFATSDGRARLMPVRFAPPQQQATCDRALVMNTGRLRDQWHTMTRSGRSPRLWSHSPELTVTLHPDDAAQRGLVADGYAIVATDSQQVRARVALSEGQRPGDIYVPMHWNGAFAADGGAALLVGAATDPHSGQPELKHSAVSVTAWQPRLTGFLFVSDAFSPPPLSAIHWTRRAIDGGTLYALATDQLPDLSALFPEEGLQLSDRKRGTARKAAFDAEGRLSACLFLGPDTPTQPGDWLLSRFALDQLLPAEDRAFLLRGSAPQATPDEGRIICACFKVGQNRIEAAIRAGSLTDFRQITDAVQAGGNCGSCIPELKEILAHVRVPA